MAFSKVILNDETLMDVTGNTSDTDNMLYGVFGTRSSGTSATGQVTLSNSNLLRNWYFAGSGGGIGEFPVNQRGLTSYTGPGFTIDGWYARNSMTVGVQSDGIHLTFPSGSTALKGLNQTFTALRNYLVGKTVTLSVLIKDFVSFGSTTYPRFGLYSGASVAVHSSSILTDVITGNGLFSITGQIGDTVLNYSNLNFTVCYANSYSGSLTVVAAKMELGTQQTLAHLEAGEWVVNEIPDYEEELLRCQTSSVGGTDVYANGTVNINTPNPNLLDNWYFIGGGTFKNFPVNQRGQTSYTVAGYGIDRWQSQRTTHTLTLNSDYIHWERTSTGYNPLFYQVVNVQPNETYTFSVLYRTTFRSVRETFTSTYLPEASDWTLYTVTGTPTTASQNAGVQDSSSANSLDDTGRYIEIKAMKLEKGSQQTLAHLENGDWVINEIPNYWDELYKCLRYVKKINAWINTYPARTDTNNLYFFIPGVMANAPSTFTSLQVYFYSGANYYTLTADCSFNHYYDGIRGTMAKSTIPDNIGGSLVIASTVFLSAES